MKNALLLPFLVVSLTVAADGDQPRFKVTTKKKDDALVVRADKDKVTFIVKSPSGISQAVIERQDDNWPKVVAMRLHLKGLESFRVSNGKVRLDAAVSSQTGKVRLWKDGKEDTPLDENSPFWIDIRMVGGDGKPAREIPLKDQAVCATTPTLYRVNNARMIFCSTLTPGRFISFIHCLELVQRFGGQYPVVAIVAITKPTNRPMPTPSHFPSVIKRPKRAAKMKQKMAITAARRRKKGRAFGFSPFDMVYLLMVIIGQLSMRTAHHPLGNPQSPGVTSSTEFPAGSRK